VGAYEPVGRRGCDSGVIDKDCDKGVSSAIRFNARFKQALKTVLLLAT